MCMWRDSVCTICLRGVTRTRDAAIDDPVEVKIIYADRATNNIFFCRCNFTSMRLSSLVCVVKIIDNRLFVSSDIIGHTILFV